MIFLLFFLSSSYLVTTIFYSIFVSLAFIFLVFGETMVDVLFNLELVYGESSSVDLNLFGDLDLVIEAFACYSLFKIITYSIFD